MKRFPNTLLALLTAATLALAALQGVNVRHLREAEKFYRWVLAESTQFRVFSQLSEEPTDPDEKNMMDRALFRQIVETAETVLPAQNKTGEDGQPLKKLLALASDESQDRAIWDLARSDAMARERADFFRYLREKRLSSVASVFDPSAVYSGQGAEVSLGNIFFGFRKLAANFVWLQVDRYWHEGAMHRMIPLMKTCVTLDPNFIDAYLVGAWHMAYNATAKMPDTPEPLKKYYPKYGVRLGEKELYYYYAIDFLKDGIRKNPRNYKLYFDLGFAIYDIKLKDAANAVKYLSEAIRHRHDRWVERTLYVCMQKNQQYEEALAGWVDYLKKYPDNTTAPRFILENKGMIKERDADRAAERAKKATDPAEAAAARAEAERLSNRALQIWKQLEGGGAEPDPFALGRIMRIQAMKLIDEDRYLEAIAVLQNAWSKSNTFADEALRMIIDIKLKAGIPLSTSERKAVMRREEAEKYKNLPPEDAAKK